MNGPRGRGRAGLLACLLLTQIGCAARGGVAGRGPTPGALPGTRSLERVGVISGEGRVRVKRDGFVETWKQEVGRCIGDTAGPVALQTFGVGLMFLPPVCAFMTAALPGMTTQFTARGMRRAVEKTLAAEDLHARLRDQIVLARRGSPALGGVEPDVAGPPLGALLEVTVTEVRVRDDGTLSGVSARVRVLRASDRRELGSRVFSHHPDARLGWGSALEPALTALSAAIVESVAPTP